MRRGVGKLCGARVQIFEGVAGAVVGRWQPSLIVCDFNGRLAARARARVSHHSMPRYASPRSPGRVIELARVALSSRM